ncbi:LPD38 domain-containing protein [Catenovulum sediminis]|uniref:LPD38 domain-containing protein n=1 Tax=Catenovulum sediminis TaxID=1740262 RepID=A0ABV1RHB3_9ALTE
MRQLIQLAKENRAKQAELKANQNTSYGGDVVDAFQMGVGNAVGGLVNFINEDAAEGIFDWAENQKLEMTDASQKALSADSLGGMRMRGVGLHVASGVGQMAATIPMGMGVGKGISALGRLKAGTTATKMSGLGLSGGASAQGQTAHGVKDQVLNTDYQTLSDSSVFKELFTQVDNSPEYAEMDDAAKLEVAKGLLADKASFEAEVDPVMWAANIGLSAIGDSSVIGVLGKSTRGRKSVPTNFAKGFAVEGTTEAMQGGVEHYQSRSILNENADPNIDPSAGLGNTMLTEGVIGGLTGGLVKGSYGTLVGDLHKPKASEGDQIDLTDPSIGGNDGTVDESAVESPELRPESVMAPQEQTSYDTPEYARQNNIDSPMQYGNLGDALINNQIHPDNVPMVDPQQQSALQNISYNSDSTDLSGIDGEAATGFNVTPYTYDGEYVPAEQSNEYASERSGLLEQGQIINDAEYYQQQGLPDKTTGVVYGSDNRPIQQAQEHADNLKQQPLALPEKNVIFTQDNRKWRGMSSGHPFRSERVLKASAPYKQAIGQGLNPEIQKAKGGYVWAVYEGETNDTNTPDTQGYNELAQTGGVEQAGNGNNVSTIRESEPTAVGVSVPEGSGANSAESLPVGSGPQTNDTTIDYSQEWQTFTPETGTKAIPRAEMPQIKAEHRGSMVQFMKGKGVDHSNGTVAANSLKPTQLEFSPPKVKKAMEFEGGNRSILVSSDGYVLDGHHQWLASKEKGERVKAIKLDAPIEKLVPLAKEFPSSEVESTGSDVPNGSLNKSDSIESITPDEKNNNERPSELVDPKYDINYNLPKNTIVGTGSDIQKLAAKPERIKQKKIRYAAVKKEESDKLEQIINQSVDGYKHVVDTSAINHTFRKHGNQSTEEKRGQIAVTEKDFNRIPEIVANPDEITNAGKDDLGNQLIRYRKAFNGTTYYVEEVRSKRKELAMKTMWKTHTREQMPAKSFPSLNAQDDSAAISHKKSIAPDEKADNKQSTEQVDKPVDKPEKANKNKDDKKPPKGGFSLPKDEKVDDFGEVLPDAKKHNYTISQALTNDVDLKNEPLSKSFPHPDYKKLSDEGVDKRALGYISVLRAKIKPKPRVSHKLSHWSDTVSLSRKIANELLTNPKIIDKLVQEKIDSEDIKSLVEIAKDIPPEKIKDLGNYSISEVHYSIYQDERNVNKIVVTDSSKKSGVGRMGNTVAFDTKEQAVKHIKKSLVDEKTNNRKVEFDFWRERGIPDTVFIGKKVAAGKFIELHRVKNISEAQRYADENYESLLEQLTSKKRQPKIRRPSNNPRTGKDHRKGENVTPELFTKTFGFRGVQFGNWVENNKRYQNLNEAYDGLLDLAEIIGVPPKALSLNGELGLSFGARGSGGKNPASAHYEPDHVVINLTKKNGAGSLAHEWWHALDHHFAERDKLDSRNKKEAPFITDNTRSIGIYDKNEGKWRKAKDSDFPIRKEVYDAFKAVTKMIQQETEIAERSAKIDKTRTKDYWSTVVEMTARSFERYVIGKLESQGYTNDYLANVINEEEHNTINDILGEASSYPYPLNAEMDAVNRAYDGLFNTLKHKTDEKGNVLLFNKTQSKPPKGVSMSAAKLALHKFMKIYQGSSDVNVVISTEDQSKVFGEQYSADKIGLAKGAFNSQDNTLYLFPKNHHNIEELRATLREEILVHKGITGLPPIQQQALLLAVMDTRNSNKKSIQDAWADIDRLYAHEHEIIKAEEFLAKVSHDRMNVLDRYFNKLLSVVHKIMVKLGLTRAEMSRADMRLMVYKMGESLKKKRDIQNNGTSNSKGVMLNKAIRTDWNDFPDVILHGKLADATSHPDYKAAKEGDSKAAIRLVADIIKTDALKQLKKLVGNEKAIALGVLAKESQGNNKIPEAMAEYIAEALGLEVSIDIIQESYVGRSTKDGFSRLGVQPTFEGNVIRNGRYIIMDDTLTQGGTLASLKGFIESSGAKVLAATALTGKQYSAKISVSDETLSRLRAQYEGTGLEKWWQDTIGYGFNKLTESEARYLINAKDADKVRERVSASRHGELSSDNEGRVAQNEYSKNLKFNLSEAAEPARSGMDKLGLGESDVSSILDKLKPSSIKEQFSAIDWKKVRERGTEGVFDSLYGIKKAEDSLNISPEKSGYISARLSTGVSDVLHGVMFFGAPQWKDGVVARKENTKGLLEVLGQLDETQLNNWLAWMGGNRADQLMKQGRENNLTQPEIDALKALNKGNEALFNEVKAEYNKINSATLDLAQEAGLVDPEARSQFDEEWYVPFFREQKEGELDLDTVLSGAMKNGKGIANQTGNLRKLKGGKQATKDILSNILERQSTLIEASMKNKAMVEVADNLNGTDYMQEIPLNMFQKQAERKARKYGKSEYVEVRKNGKDTWYKVKDASLMRAFMQLGMSRDDNPLMKMSRAAKRFLTTGVTLSPDFIIRNFIRDSVHGWMINKDGFKFGKDSYIGMKQTWASDEATLDLMFAGASFQGGYVHGNDPDKASQQIRRSLRKKGLSESEITKYLGTVAKNTGELFERYRSIADAMENANRASTYTRAKESGKSAKVAAFEAKDFMDFSLQGNFKMMQFFIDVLPFFNARMQGLYKLYRAGKAEGDDKFLKYVSRELMIKGSKVAAFSVALAMLNSDDERYEDLQDWDKDSNWHFFLGDTHIRVPKPFELGVIFGTVPERMFNTTFGNQTSADFKTSIVHALTETMAMNPIPQLIKPGLEAYMNHSFFKDGPIEGLGDQFKRPQDRYSLYTSETAKALGSALGFSPKKIEHLVQGYLGTMGMYVIGAADMLANGAAAITGNGEFKVNEFDDLMLIRKFVKHDEVGGGYYAKQFYDMMSNINGAYNQYKNATAEQDQKAIEEILKDNKVELSFRKRANRAMYKLNMLNKRKNLIGKSQMAQAKKDDILDEIRIQQNAIYKRIILEYRALD